MTRLFEPVVLGRGITIGKAPTLPNHGVRKKDLEAHVKVVKYDLENVTTLEIDKATDDYIIQCFDTNGDIVWPDKVRPTSTKVFVDFLNPQSGVVRVLFIGGTSGD